MSATILGNPPIKIYTSVSGIETTFSSITVTDFAKTLLDDSNATFARTTLGVASGLSADSYVNFLHAIIEIASTVTCLVVNTIQYITDNTIIPSTLSIKMEGAGKFVISGGWTLTINGPFSADLKQVFSGAGTVIFGTDSVKEVYPQWWGALGDDSTDDTTAIQSAITAYDYVYFPKGIYKITNVLTISTTNKTLNLGKSTIKQYTKVKDIITLYGTSYYERVEINDGFLYHNDVADATSGSAISVTGSGCNISFINIENVKTYRNGYGFLLNGVQTIWMSSFKKFHNLDVYYGGIRINPTTSYPTTIELENCYTNNITADSPGYYFRKTYSINLNSVSVDNSARFLDIVAGNININNCGAEWVQYNDIADDASVIYLQTLNEQIVNINGLCLFLDDSLDYSVTTGHKYLVSVIYGTAVINGLDIKTTGGRVVLPLTNYPFLFLNPSNPTKKSTINNLFIQDIKHLESTSFAVLVSYGCVELGNMSSGYTIQYYNGGTIYNNMTLAATPTFHYIWDNGRIIYDTSGSSLGWICTTAGSSGTLNAGGTTGSIKLASYIIVVNSLTGLLKGDKITIVDAGGAGDLSTTVKWLPATKGNTTVAIQSSGTTLYMTSSTNFSVGDNLVLDRGNANEEYPEIKSISGNTVTLSATLVNIHVIGVTIENGVLITDAGGATVTNKLVSYTTPVWGAISGGPGSSQYVIYTDGVSTFRAGVRTTNYVIDRIIGPLGFAGVEGVDWENVGGTI